MKNKLLLILVLVTIMGCKEKASPPIVIHDTVFIDKPIPYIDEPKLKETLILYYKQGWMDASNGIIELSNQNKFSDYSISILKKRDWARMENVVNTK